MTQKQRLVELFHQYGNKLTLGQIPKPCFRYLKSLIMSGKEDNSYTNCWLWSKGKMKSGYGEVRIVPNTIPIYIHRLSAVLYLKYKGEKDIHILHKCDIKHCFNPDHLYLGTRKDNARDALERGQHLIGEKCPWSKVSIKNIDQIFSLKKKGFTQLSISKVFNISQTQISRIINMKNWKRSYLPFDQDKTGQHLFI